MRKNYLQLWTKTVRPYRAYEKDFTTPGDFEEENSDNEILLILKGDLGLWSSPTNEWSEPSNSDISTSYSLVLFYNNKDNVDITFAAKMGKHSAWHESSYAIVKSAAKKFALVNCCLLEERIEEEGFLRDNILITWKEIETIIDLYITETGNPSEGNSWTKSMTVKEAKKLFAFLKIEINFPS